MNYMQRHHIFRGGGILKKLKYLVEKHLNNLIECSVERKRMALQAWFLDF